MKKIVVGFFILASTLAAAGEGLPEGWYKIGDGSMEGYEVIVQPDAGINGSGVRISRVDEVDARFGGVGQAISAEKYAGKTVKLTGFIRTEGVDEGYAGLWFRVDRGKDILLLDNMNDRGVSGTREWQPYESILFVDPEATKLLFGALLTGNGTMQADQFSLQIVPDDTPTTRSVIVSQPAQPRNLDF